MPSPPHRVDLWQLDRYRATCSLGAMSATINLERPDLGLQALQLDAAAIDGNLLAVSSTEIQSAWPAKLTDAYVRGNDVVATYAGDAAWPYAPQIYWSAEDRAEDRPSLAALSLVVSIQTNLLDTHPRLFAHSTLPAVEVLLVSVVSGHSGDEMLVDSHVEGVQSIDRRSSACGILWRFKDGTPSYAEIMPTSDFRRLSVERSDGTCSSRWELFSEFLEKGVIRRARLQAMFVPRENDVQLGADCCRSIEGRPLPLTT